MSAFASNCGWSRVSRFLADAHKMPGDGRINWQELVAKLRTAPRLMTMQSEVAMFTNGYSIGNLVKTFNKIMQ